MSKPLGPLLFIMAVVACGGSTGTGEEGGGTSPGGTGQGGKNAAGSSSGGAAGKSTGGSVSTAGRDAGGAAGFGGVIVIGGYGGAGTSGTAGVDPRCPDVLPNGSCEEAGLMCRYDFNGCLCYPQDQSTYCPKVDTTCVGGPAAAAPPPNPGAGGFTTKIAIVPPPQLCACSAGMWACSDGF